jgi:hypothetical protein
VLLLVSERIAEGLADPKGVPVGYDLVGPKTGQERDSALGLAAAHSGSVLLAA